MADTKISALPNATALGGTEQIAAVQSASNVNITPAQIKTYMQATATPLASGGTGAALVDPGADRVLFWDDSAGAVTWLTVGSGLTVTDTTITASGGVTGFTAAESTSSPNTVVYVDSLTATASSTNADVAICPKGSGALMGHIPDGTATGGNKRGTYAVDWQRNRASAAKVAQGSYSTVSGGRDGVAVGSYTTVSGGYFGTSTGDYATVGGGSVNTANGTYSTVSGGNTNSGTGDTSTVGGGWLNTASGTLSTVSGGYNNTASGHSAWVPGGRDATTRGLIGAYAYSAGQRAALGDAQIIGQPVRRATTDATPVSLSTSGTAPAAGTSMAIPSGAAVWCTATVVAKSGNDVFGGTWVALAKNLAGTTTVVGSTTKVAGSADTALAACDVSIVANDTLDSVEIQVTGIAATTIYWVGELQCAQVVV